MQLINRVGVVTVQLINYVDVVICTISLVLGFATCINSLELLIGLRVSVQTIVHVHVHEENIFREL